jgi:type IV secretory pathway VirB10-like protein
MKSEELGLYFMLTNVKDFENAKKFVTDTLPKIWAKLDNTFLNELPPSVQCPRLTTSNLKDKTTKRTAKMLAEAYIPDGEETTASKWARAPQINKPPTRAVIVNYTEDNFPEMTRQKNKRTNLKSSNSSSNPTTSSKSNQNETKSNHSTGSATSTGTTFTREDRQLLFTSLTESCMSDIKNHRPKQLCNKTRH